MKIINRIKSNQEFGVAVKKGQTLKSSSYVIHYLKNDLSICRVGISVSTKIGNAVVRNRIKRQIRAMCDSMIEYNDHAFDIVIIVRKDFLTKDFLTNSQELKKLFEKIGIIE